MGTPYPQVSGITDPAAQQSIRLLWERYGNLFTLLEDRQAHQALNAQSQRLTQVAASTDSTSVVPKATADSTYLSASSTLADLVKLLYQSAEGLLPWLLQHLGATEKTTVPQPALYTATLNPDTKPTHLGLPDTGALLYATDFDRLYIWTGSGWADAPGQPPRQITALWLDSTTQIPTGWHLCDNSSVRLSTPTATTVAFTATVVNANRCLLVSSAGGSLTGSDGPYVTGFESADTALLQPGSGSTETVASHNHTHSFSSLIPAYTTVLPIIRL